MRLLSDSQTQQTIVLLVLIMNTLDLKIKSALLSQALLVFNLELTYLMIYDCCDHLNTNNYKTQLCDRRNKISQLAYDAYDKYVKLSPYDIISSPSVRKIENAYANKFLISFTRIASAIAGFAKQSLINNQ